MNHQINLLIFFSLSFFVQVMGQDASTKRAPGATDPVTWRTNAAETFEYQLFRFESALADGDQESTNVMHKILLTRMEEYLQKMPVAEIQEKKIDNRELTEIKNKLEQFNFQTDRQHEPVFQQHKSLFDAFLEHMKEPSNE